MFVCLLFSENKGTLTLHSTELYCIFVFRNVQLLEESSTGRAYYDSRVLRTLHYTKQSAIFCCDIFLTHIEHAAKFLFFVKNNFGDVTDKLKYQSVTFVFHWFKCVKVVTVIVFILYVSSIICFVIVISFGGIVIAPRSHKSNKDSRV